MPAAAASHTGTWGAVIGIIIIVILLAAGGAYFFYMQQQIASEPATNDTASQAAANNPNSEDAIQNDLNATANTSASGDVDTLNNSL